MSLFKRVVYSSILQVFEHQRELTLSLLESLNFDGTLSVGFISFTSQPRLHIPLSNSNTKEHLVSIINGVRIRLQLPEAKKYTGLKYTGGSTNTADAVAIATSEFRTNARSDAVHVLALLNDGYSQDLWPKVNAHA